MNKINNIKVKLTSTIIQEDSSETFTRTGLGNIEETTDGFRINYDEISNEGIAPVKLFIKPRELVMQRGEVVDNNYNMMKFKLGEKKNCRIIAASKIMDLTSLTNKLDFSGKIDDNMKLFLEYELFSGLYLIGNYTIKIDFYHDEIDF